MKHINTGSESREKLLKGINAVADIVKETLGPCGSNVILKKPYNIATIVNDGVSIAKEVVLQDPTENAGAELLTAAASATNASVGDGTTTTCILTQGIIQRGFNLINAGTVNPILLREALKKCAEKDVYPALEKQIDPADTLEKLQHVATISVGGNKELGDLIGNALNKVGVDGVVNIENNSFPETKFEMIEGYKIDRGYMTPYAINDTEKYRVEYENCFVLCCYHKIIERADVESLFQWAYQNGKSILLIVEDIDESIFAGLQVNLMKKVFRICPVKSPGFGFNVRDYMNDISKLTGCMVYADDTRRMSTFTPDDFGFATKVTANRECTCIITDKESSEGLSDYVIALKNQLANTENGHLKDSLKERISKLTVGVATISVGATSQTEQEELKLRIEDAVNATRAALKGGIVTGGGCALACIAEELDLIKENSEFTCAENYYALEILSQTFSLPEKQIIANSGGLRPSLEELKSALEVRDYKYGFNGKTKTFENLRDAGVIDPALVVKSAIENAISIASTVLTTQATIISEDKGE